MNEVRVRFAPSPTGYVHLGSLRTALYNYLFAKHNKGKLILRIEDTDRNRMVAGAVENLLQTLKWSGIDYDEGPEKESSCGPFYQSHRLDIYTDHMNQLLESGKAYPCFCSEERLSRMRERQAAKNLPIMYDGHCRGLDPAKAKAIMRDKSHVIRLKVPRTGLTRFKDIIREDVEFQNEVIDDQVLVKSDGFPTYHFANVVDDHLMRITHVIRGEEWLPSTPKHLMLYDAFSWQPPQFAHLPLLLNPDRSKLSKRQGDVAVEDYRAKGILPEALINFVALLGWHRGDDKEIFSLPELIEDFSLERVNKSGAVFDMEKLKWMNGQYIRALPDEQYLETASKWLENNTSDSRTTKKVLLGVRERISAFGEIPEKTKIFYTDKPEYTPQAKECICLKESIRLFNAMLEEMKKIHELNIDSFKQLMQRVQTVTGIKGKQLWMPVRAALTAETAGPELPLVIEVFGKDKVARLLHEAIKLEDSI